MIDGRDEFGHHVKTSAGVSYSVIDYNVNFRDTFPIMAGSDEERTIAALRRECRGIVYDPDTGLILSRPFHKFFNAGERVDTLVEDIDLSQPHYVLEKLDGSMIRTIRTANGTLLWGTRAGVTDVSEQARRFLEGNDRYTRFAHEWHDRGYTLMFEWCTRKNRIVLDYPKDELVLTAIRNISDGSYLSYPEMSEFGKSAGLPVVATIGQKSNARDFLTEVKAMTGLEGFVIAFDDGHRVKLKADEYCLIHHSKDELRFEKNAIRIVLENRMDDIAPHLIPADRTRLVEFGDVINTHITNLAARLRNEFENLRIEYPVRKLFAGAVNGHQYKQFMFRMHDGKDVRNEIVQTILGSLQTQNRVNEVRHLIGAEWAPLMFFSDDA